MEGATFLGRYATSTDDTSGDLPSDAAVSFKRYWRKRADGDAMRPEVLLRGTLAQGLQFFCGRSRLPLRVANSTLPPASEPWKWRRPHWANEPTSSGSLSTVPSFSSSGPSV